MSTPTPTPPPTNSPPRPRASPSLANPPLRTNPPKTFGGARTAVLFAGLLGAAWYSFTSLADSRRGEDAGRVGNHPLLYDSRLPEDPSFKPTNSMARMSE